MQGRFCDRWSPQCDIPQCKYKCATRKRNRLNEKHQSANPRHNLTGMYIVTFGLKTPLHVLHKHNGTKTELYRTNTKGQSLVPAHFSLIIIIVVDVVEHQSVINEKH